MDRTERALKKAQDSDRAAKGYLKRKLKQDTEYKSLSDDKKQKRFRHEEEKLAESRWAEFKSGKLSRNFITASC
jgi:hypothetical protein